MVVAWGFVKYETTEIIVMAMAAPMPSDKNIMGDGPRRPVPMGVGSSECKNIHRHQHEECR